MDSISASVSQFETVQFVPPPPVVETKPPLEAPAPSRPDSFESTTPKVSMANFDSAKNTIKSKDFWNAGQLIDSNVKLAGKELVEAGKYMGPVTDKEAEIIRGNLSGKDLKEFNTNFAAGKYSKPLDASKVEKLQAVIKNPDSKYVHLDKERATVEQLGFNLMASPEYAAYKNPSAAPQQIASLRTNGRALNTKG